MDKEIPMMPDEFYGDYTKKNAYVKNTPRKWTKDEVDWCSNLSENGFTYEEIAKSTCRDVVSVSIKMKRLKKKDGSYNSKHVMEKYKVNEEYIDFLKPKSILDVYCGVNSVYSSVKANVVTNDINKSIVADYNMDSLKLLCHLYSEDKKFDFIDLDPYGSASDCFDLAIKMANKGMAITFGEIGHKRFKRLDYVRRHYDIHTLDEFTTDNLIKYVQKIGAKNKKNLVVYRKCEWNGISRAWFLMEGLKITEQWD